MRALLAFAAILGCTGCVDIVGSHLDSDKVVEREQKHFTTTGKPEVELFTHDGSIEVRPSDRPDVDVTIEKRGPSKESLEELLIEATQTGNRVRVDVRSKHDGGWHFGRSANAKLIVSLPETSDVRARSGDGSIDVERLAGRVELSSGDGSIRAHDLNGDVDVRTGDGSITLDGKFGALKASSGDGSVRIHAGEGSNATGDWVVTTGDGSITMELPDGFNANIDAHTGDGRVHVENLTVSNVSGEIAKNSLKGQIGSGGRTVKLRTGDGSITLRRP